MNYKFNTKEEQIETLINFLNTEAEWAYDYETSNNNAGNAYIFDSGILDMVYNLNDVIRHADEELTEYIKMAERIGMSKEQILDLLKQSVVAEPGSIEYPTNAFVGSNVDEIEVQLSGVDGIVNGKKVGKNEVQKLVNQLFEKADISSDYAKIIQFKELRH